MNQRLFESEKDLRKKQEKQEASTTPSLQTGASHLPRSSSSIPTLMCGFFLFYLFHIILSYLILFYFILFFAKERSPGRRAGRNNFLGLCSLGLTFHL